MNRFGDLYYWTLIGVLGGIVLRYYRFGFHRSKIPVRYLVADNWSTIVFYCLAKSLIVSVCSFLVVCCVLPSSVSEWLTANGAALPSLAVVAGAISGNALYLAEVLRGKFGQFLDKRTQKAIEESLTRTVTRERALVESWVNTSLDRLRGELRDAFEQSGAIQALYEKYREAIEQRFGSGEEIIVEDARALANDANSSMFTMFQLLALFRLIGYGETKNELKLKAQMQDVGYLARSLSASQRQLSIVVLSAALFVVAAQILGVLYVNRGVGMSEGVKRLENFRFGDGGLRVSWRDSIVTCFGLFDPSSIVDPISTHVWCLARLPGEGYLVGQELRLDRKGSWMTKPFRLPQSADSLVFVQVSDRDHVRFLGFLSDTSSSDMLLIPSGSAILAGCDLMRSCRGTTGNSVLPH